MFKKKHRKMLGQAVVRQSSGSHQALFRAQAVAQLSQFVNDFLLFLHSGSASKQPTAKRRKLEENNMNVGPEVENQCGICRKSFQNSYR